MVNWSQAFSSVKNAAGSYCKIRLTLTAIFLTVLSVCLLATAVWVRIKQNTTGYAPVGGTVTGGTVTVRRDAKTKNPVYWATRTIAYTVNKNTYRAEATSTFASKPEADTFVKKGTAVSLYYNPKDPSKSSSQKGGERVASWLSCGCSVVIAASAIWSWYMRTNPLYCGFTVLSNSASMASSVISSFSK